MRALFHPDSFVAWITLGVSWLVTAYLVGDAVVVLIGMLLLFLLVTAGHEFLRHRHQIPLAIESIKERLFVKTYAITLVLLYASFVPLLLFNGTAYSTVTIMLMYVFPMTFLYFFATFALHNWIASTGKPVAKSVGFALLTAVILLVMNVVIYIGAANYALDSVLWERQEGFLEQAKLDIPDIDNPDNIQILTELQNYQTQSRDGLTDTGWLVERRRCVIGCDNYIDLVISHMVAQFHHTRSALFMGAISPLLQGVGEDTVNQIGSLETIEAQYEELGCPDPMVYLENIDFVTYEELRDSAYSRDHRLFGTVWSSSEGSPVLQGMYRTLLHTKLIQSVLAFSEHLEDIEYRIPSPLTQLYVGQMNPESDVSRALRLTILTQILKTEPTLAEQLMCNTAS